MAHRRTYLNFQVHLTDPVQVAALQTQYPQGRIMAPDDAATEYSAPIQLDTAAFSAPCTRSIWFQNTANYPRDVRTFVRKTGSLWSLITTGQGRYFWVAQFVYAYPVGTNQQGTSALTATMPTAQRKFACGFELPADAAGTQIGEGPTMANPPMVGRAASRLPGGYGVQLRGANGRVTMPVNRNGASNTRSSWSRLYACRRANATGYLWSATTTSGRGVFLKLIDGVGILEDGTSGSGVAIGSIPSLLPTLDEWVRIDILLRWGDFGTGDPTAQIRILRNGLEVLSVDTVANNNGITVETGALHTQSDLGFGGTIASGFAVDVDDWICSEFPGTNGRAWISTQATVVDNHYYHSGRWYKALAVQTGTPPNPLTDTASWQRLAGGVDFQNGSHVARVSAKALSASDSGWAGDFRILQQVPLQTPAAHLQARTSSTSAAVCQVTTDFAERVLNRAGVLGVPSFTVATWANRGAIANDGSVGYKLGAAAPVSGTITQTTVPALGRLMYRPAGAVSLPAISALELLHTKGADAGAASCYGLAAAVELVGNFSSADIPPESSVTGAVATRMGAALSHIPVSQWVQSQLPPLSPVIIKAGQYVGNGTGQDLTFAAPPSFIYIRGAGGADQGGVWWYPALQGAHHGNNESPSSSLLTEVRENIDYTGPGTENAQDQQYYVRVAGSNNQINANGVTYQYVAVMDPGCRFLLSQNGGFDSAYTGGLAVRLQNADFTPEGVMAFSETPGNATGNLKKFKGPGHNATQIAENANSVTATALAMAQGVLTMHPSLNSGGRTTSFLCVRSNDNSGDPGVERVVQVQTWTGNGSGARDILIPGSTGRRPLLVVVWANDNGGMHFRDPSHTTNTSSRYDGASIANAITAGGIDQFTVGAALNVNTVVYNALIFVGGTTAGNGGWSATAVEEVPVEPDSSNEGDYDDLTDEDFEDQGIDPETGEDVEAALGDAELDPGLLDTDIATNCVQASTRLVNVALSRIGVGKTISNLGTDTSQEAVCARTVYKTEIDACLRDFPWPFATRYADLAYVAGELEDPVNGDWTFSYRAPTDYVLIRRVVNSNDKREASRTPSPFKMGTDDDGDLVYANEPGDQLAVTEDLVADYTLPVEYTARLACPALRGDPIFRSAAAWRLARALCEPLGRDAKKAEFCEKQYVRELLRARAVHLAEQEQQHHEHHNEAEWIQGRE